MTKTDCTTGKITEEEMKWKVIKKENGEEWFHVLNGSTGNESFKITSESAKRLTKGKWIACSGTTYV